MRTKHAVSHTRMRQTSSGIELVKTENAKEVNGTDMFWSRLQNTSNQTTHSFSGFCTNNVKNKTLTHLTLSPCANVGLFNDVKTLSGAPADCNTFFLKWELKCYRQLEESLEFPWNEVLNETWSDWQVCSLSHWAFSVFLQRFVQRGKGRHISFTKIKSQCM